MIVWLGVILQNALSYVFKKFETISAAITFTFLAYAFATTNISYNPDYQLYQNSYMLHWKNFENGYIYISNIFSNLGFSFQDFRAFVGVIVFLGILIGSRLITKHVSIIALVYAIEAFPLDTIQIRNAILTFLIIMSCVLWNKDGTVSKISCITILLISTLFHSLAYMFILYYFIFLLSSKIGGLYKKIAYAIIFISMLSEIIGYGWLVKIVNKFTLLSKNRGNLLDNFNTVYIQGTQFKTWILIFIITLVVIWIINNAKSYLNENGLLKIDSYIVMVTIGLLFTTISVDFIRIYRVLIILILLFLLSNIKKEKIDNGMIRSRILVEFGTLSLGFLYVQVHSIYLISNGWMWLL